MNIMNERRLQRIVGTVAVLVIVGLAAAIGSLDYQQEIDDDMKIFRACYGTIIAILGCIQLYVAITLYQHRNNLLLELYQPVWLAIFAICGALTTFASFMFALPEYDISCALRQPIIFSCLTFMGNILIVRTWRIGCIMGVSQSFREDDNGSAQIEISITMSRLAIMKVLSRISSWRGLIRSCGKKKSIDTTGIRCKITFADSMWVVVVLLIPQLVLQIINLALPNVRLESVEVYEEVYVCESGNGSWSLVVGIVLFIIPFIVSLLLNTTGDGAVPNQFRELSEIASSLFISCCILIITLPTATMVKYIIPEVYTYLMGASVLSFTLPYASNIAWKRACVIKSHGMKKPTTRTSSERSSSKPAALDKDSENTFDRLKEAGDAAIMSKMFETMGQQNKALEIDRGILSLFKSDGEYSWEDGFNTSEIRSLGPKELQVVVSTMIDSAKRWWKVFQFERKSIEDDKGEEAKSRAFRTCMGGLNLFKEAPAKKLLKDRSVVFPGYSFMVSMIKTLSAYNPPDGQSHEDFENNLANSFVKEADFQQYHLCRSLAMKVDMMRRHGRYEDAVSALDEMKLTYKPHLHSRVLVQEYVSDHCAEIIALSVSWLCYLNRQEEAPRLCDYVIEKIIPEIGERELFSLTVILYPICLCLKDQGKQKAALHYSRCSLLPSRLS